MHIENADLNLLKALDVLLEERHVSRAAARFHLSQSAMSRTLTRLRETFGDELLVRTTRGYELTPRARAIRQELEFILPRLRAMVRGGDFDPATSTDAIRVNCTDYAISILGPGLLPHVFERAPNLSLTIEPLSPRTYDEIEHGRVDLALSPVQPPAGLRWQPLFEEDYVGVVAADHPLTADRLTLDEIREFPRVSVVVLPQEQMVIDRRLAELGVAQRSGLRVPYFEAAFTALPGTRLIALVPRRLVEARRADHSVRLVEAPTELAAPFPYGMVWHPRLNSDPAHVWVRSKVGEVAAGLRPGTP
ncbi:LysR family transcriptional regulator [Kutzneria buriramensis]|uniref:DNA-binding transcriptional LysR family regulator n=1 Tax=Kutzneria buriramensis TaxID=1045776 RepID=A0A3E0I649_9PSEU|nr:LysR family transcriptional regulator [Kutzneria buriramensis]REH54199.1 DNA-binding transcriptional LysR family regulator [Kutzneria buriramensis]